MFNVYIQKFLGCGQYKSEEIECPIKCLNIDEIKSWNIKLNLIQEKCEFIIESLIDQYYF